MGLSKNLHPKPNNPKDSNRVTGQGQGLGIDSEEVQEAVGELLQRKEALQGLKDRLSAASGSHD
jgi:hypothetical protein